MEAGRASEHDEGRKTDLFKIMEQRGRVRLTAPSGRTRSSSGIQLATELIERAVEALGAGIASAVNLLDVEAVVIGGGLGAASGSR